MPCWEVRTVSVEFRAENRTLLGAAIKAVDAETRLLADGRYALYGGAIKLDLANGKAEVEEGYQFLLNKLKQAYSREAVKAAAKRCQWGVKFTGVNKATINKVQW